MIDCGELAAGVLVKVIVEDASVAETGVLNGVAWPAGVVAVPALPAEPDVDSWLFCAVNV